MNSIKSKLIVIIVAVLVLGLGGISLLSYQKTKEILLGNVEQSMVSQAISSGSEISLWLEARKSEVAMLANSPIILKGGREEIISYMAGEVKRNSYYETLYVSDKTGAYFNSNGKTSSVADRDYFKQAMSTGEIAVSDPVISKTTGSTIVVVAVPIIRNGVADGIVGGTVMVKSLVDKINSIKVGETGYAYMMQKDGTIIAHPDKELVMKYNPLKEEGADPKLVEAAQRMTGGETGIILYNYDNMDKFTAFAPVPGMNWSLAVTAPVAELSSQLASLPVTSAVTALVFIAVIGAFSGVLMSRMTGSLRQLADEAVRIGDGDLTRDIAIKSGDEIGQLAGTFNTMQEKLKKITGQFQEKSRALAMSSGELSTVAENVTAGATETASTASEMAATVEHVAASVQQIADSSVRAASYAEEGNRGIQGITEQMSAIQKATAASGEIINGLNESSVKISQIVELITQIAEQTNLLALNAAIEAARAGEQGRGFAVVAEEVRKLAEQSAGAAKEIYTLITAIQEESGRAVRSMKEGSEQVEAGTTVVRDVGGTLEKIITAVRELAGDIHSVAEAAEEISSAVRDVAAAAEEQTATMEEVSSITQSLAGLSDELENLSRQFRLK
ncbi:methyl-accepting chemotaxis protein I [Desulfocucumis palustris]|uniref:Methyl-accepting chemotaxis protein I n=1 Tax=Desulfocucumis palustris TaxID=1898651 RepID=A0A2L2XKB5_9FIRM|nr:methyl-accepting chemotaxis protein [Desulfocucumis palustris]GBF34736.1 methyl-accepting chemotaxis protein I [Desulfocucumis palustris]